MKTYITGFSLWPFIPGLVLGNDVTDYPEAEYISTLVKVSRIVEDVMYSDCTNIPLIKLKIALWGVFFNIFPVSFFIYWIAGIWHNETLECWDWRRSSQQMIFDKIKWCKICNHRYKCIIFWLQEPPSFDSPSLFPISYCITLKSSMKGSPEVLSGVPISK